MTNSKQLIAFAHYSGSKDISGVTTWLQKLLLYMQRKQFNLMVYLLYFGNNPHEGSFHSFLREHNISVTLQKRSFFLEDDIYNTLNFINQYRPSIFLPQCLESFQYAARIAGISGLPWIQTIHSDESVYWFYAKHCKAEECSGKVVAVSGYLRDQLIQRGYAQHPAAIPPGGVSRQLGMLTQFREAPFRVVYSGRMIEEQKRISLVIESMMIACELDQRVECWLIGDGSYREVAESWVRKRNLWNKFRFFGRVESSEVYGLLQECQVILLLSDYEGFGLAIAEAMAVGVVPVARNIPAGIPEMVIDQKTGILVDDNPRRVAQEIVNLLNNPQVWAQYSQAAFQHIHSHFSEDVIFDRWIEMIESVMQTSEPRYPIKFSKNLGLPIPSTMTEMHRRRSPEWLLPLRVIVKLSSMLGRKLKRRVDLIRKL